jgi:hypothetical protein
VVHSLKNRKGYSLDDVKEWRYYNKHCVLLKQSEMHVCQIYFNLICVAYRHLRNLHIIPSQPWWQQVRIYTCTAYTRFYFICS